MKRLLGRIRLQSLTVQIVSALILLGIVPVLILWGFTIVESRKAKPVDQYLRTLVDNAAQLIRNEGFEQSYTSLEAAARDPIFRSQFIPASAMAFRLRYYASVYPQFSTLTLVDLGGTTFASSSEANTKDWRGQAVFERAKGGEAAASPARFSSASPDPIVSFAVPVRNPEGATVAVMIGEVPVAEVAEPALELTIGSQGHAFVVDAAGQIIAHPDVAQIRTMWALVASEEEIDQFPSTVTVREQGGSFVYSVAPIAARGMLDEWRVALRAPASEVYGYYQRTQRVILALGAGVTLLIVVLAPVLAASISRPVQKAQKALSDSNVTLAAINKELEAFSYSVSHDLRAPLRSIDGFSQVLLEDYEEKLDAQGKDYLNRVRTASQRMGQLIDDMLSLSRVTRREMHEETVDLSSLAHSLATELKESRPDRQVKFVIAEGLAVKGDKELLRSVLQNLLGNSWKYSGKHPQATIEFGIAQQNGLATYFVRDDGAGFDMAYVDKLFGTFQRLHTGAEFEGTGIGLATVQRIVHRHGGRIWAEGAVEKGATFYFTLHEQDNNAR